MNACSLTLISKPDIRICTKCHEEKHKTNFYKYNGFYRRVCKGCMGIERLESGKVKRLFPEKKEIEANDIVANKELIRSAWV